MESLDNEAEAWSQDCSIPVPHSRAGSQQLSGHQLRQALLHTAAAGKVPAARFAAHTQLDQRLVCARPCVSSTRCSGTRAARVGAQELGFRVQGSGFSC